MLLFTIVGSITIKMLLYNKLSKVSLNIGCPPCVVSMLNCSYLLMPAFFLSFNVNSPL